MGELKGDSSPDNNGLSQEIKELTDIEIARYGISADVKNSILSLIPPPFGVSIDKITRIQEYGEYFSDKTYGDYVMSKSEPVLVKEWDSKIRAFNNDLERIKRERDEQKVKAFYDDMMAFFKLRTKKV